MFVVLLLAIAAICLVSMIFLPGEAIGHPIVCQ